MSPFLNSTPIHSFDASQLKAFPFYESLLDPPSSLFVQGKPESLELLNRLPQEGLAIVGTRTPYPKTGLWTSQCLLRLKGSRKIILSGLARGIDTLAHKVALDSNLPTIAILGTGLEYPTYPPENTELRQKILDHGGLLLSEFPLNSPPIGFHFLKRNRLIAGLAQATWIVQAGFRSGALNTAKWAREMNKTCYATPCLPGDPGFAGNQVLLDRDHALCFWGIHSLGSTWLELSTWNLNHSATQRGRHSLAEKEIQAPSDPTEAVLLNYLSLLTYNQGGGNLEELLLWAEQKEIPSQTLLQLLQDLCQTQRVIQTQGLWMSV